LRKAGIKLSDSSTSFLYVRVTALKSSGCPGLYGSHVQVEFTRIGTLEAAKGISFNQAVTVWKRGALAFDPSGDFAINTRQKVSDLCDRFLNDFLAANPAP